MSTREIYELLYTLSDMAGLQHIGVNRPIKQAGEYDEEEEVLVEVNRISEMTGGGGCLVFVLPEGFAVLLFCHPTLRIFKVNWDG